MEPTIAIMAAMEEEVKEIKEIMENLKENYIYEIHVYEGTINGLKVILVQTGVGKVNAARTTQIIIDRYNISYIINVGTAGGVNENLKIGDIVVGEKLLQHDFDITAFGHEKGYITGLGTNFESDKGLVAKVKETTLKLKDINIVIGTIASGDIFCTEVKMKEKIRKKFRADCVEMESAAVAQVCVLDKMPFIVIRSISDIPNENNAVTFDKFIKCASKKCAELIKVMIYKES